MAFHHLIATIFNTKSQTRYALKLQLTCNENNSSRD